MADGVIFTCSGYVGEFELIDDHRSGKVVIELVGRINKCGVISPRFDVALGQIEQWTGNLLPSRQFGYIVLTTSLGIMDHEEVILLPIFVLMTCTSCWVSCLVMSITCVRTHFFYTYALFFTSSD